MILIARISARDLFVCLPLYYIYYYLFIIFIHHLFIVFNDSLSSCIPHGLRIYAHRRSMLRCYVVNSALESAFEAKHTFYN